jgi:AcrR family transcriptional regulator
MRGTERRELILESATRVFGDYGYFGATTNLVAKSAGVSQPYVIRMFGTKEQLFLEVLRRSVDRLLTVFRAVVAEESARSLAERLGEAYVDMIDDRGLLLSLMHGFVLGREPQIGPASRRGFMEVYEFLRIEAGFTPLAAEQFVASGMLINTMVGLRMADDFDSDSRVRELLESAVPHKLERMLAIARTQHNEDA